MKVCLVAPGSIAAVHPHDFFVRALAEKGVATRVVDCDGRSPIELGLDLAARLAANNFDRLIFWGAEEAALGMQGIGTLGRMAIAPAALCNLHRPPAWWQRFQTLRILAFSRSLHEQLLQAGLASAHFQYYAPAIPSARLVDVVAERSAMLWERTGSTVDSIQRAAAQCRALGLQRIYVANPAQSEDVERLAGLKAAMAGFVDLDLPPPGVRTNIEMQLRMHACFIAPSRGEGINSELISAISAGRIVIAPDVTPIQDYVGHLATGILYDPADPLALPWLDIRRWTDLAAAARDRADRGGDRWQADAERLLSLIAEDGRRWSTTDRSANFANLIRRRASEAARQNASKLEGRKSN